MSFRSQKTWTALCAFTLTFSALPSLADVSWRGDFSGNNLNQYYQIQCGAYSGTYVSDGIANSGWCPYGQQNKTQLTNTTTNLCPNSGITPTPPGDVVGCRFALTEPPAPSSYFAYRPAGAALRVRVGKDSGSSNGDSAPALGSPWGGDFRSEVVSPKVGTANKTFLPDEDVYFGFNAFVPGTAEFAAPGAETNGAYWHTLLQFHSEGECGSPNLQIGITRSDTATRKEKGEDYIFSLSNVGSYPSNSTRLWPTQEQTALDRQRWYQFVLRVKWSTTACNNGAGSCNWSAPNGGLIQLWQNGTLVYQGAHPTLFNYNSNPLACPEDNGKSGLMAAYLKHGLYRHRLIPSVENVYLHGLRTGSSYADVDTSSRDISVPLWTTVNAVAADRRENSDGAVFIGGDTTNNLNGTFKGINDAYLMRVKADGTTDWVVQQDMSSTNNDSVQELAFSSVDNTVVVAGVSSGSLFNSSNSGQTVFLAKYNQKTGVRLWGKMLTRSYADQTVRGLSVNPLTGQILVGGATWEFGNHSTGDSYLALFDSNGNQTWYQAPYFSTSVSGDKETQAVHYAADGAAYLAIDVGGNRSSNLDATQFYVARIDTSGLPVWSRTLASTNGRITVKDIETNGRGGLIVVGGVYGQFDGVSTPTTQNSFVLNLNTNSGPTQGQTNWVHQYPGPQGPGANPNNAIANGVAIDNQGIAYVAGGSNDLNGFSTSLSVYRVDLQGNREIVRESSTTDVQSYRSVDFGGNHVYAGGYSDANYGLLFRH